MHDRFKSYRCEGIHSDILAEKLNLQICLFLLFILVYFTTLVVIGDDCLDLVKYIPTYFFFSNLSFYDICYSVVFAPKVLVNFLAKHQSSTFSVTTEGILLSMIVYDRYATQQQPIPWSLVIKTQRVCIQMVVASYLGGLINSLTHTIGLLDFCGLIVNHYFWDIPLLLRLSCSDIHNKEMLLLIFSGVAAMFIFTIIVGSYIHISIAICESIQLRGGAKHFPFCASHLTSVTLFYGSLTFGYIQPSSQQSLQQKVFAVFYTLVIPVPSPLIYSLKKMQQMVEEDPN